MSEIETLYKVVSAIILDYETPLPLWQKCESDIIFSNRLAHCVEISTECNVAIMENQNFFYKFKVKGDCVATSFETDSPTSQLMIAFDSHQNTLYLKDWEKICMFDMNFNLLGSFKILFKFKETFGFTMDDRNIYLTTRNAICTLDKMNGLVLQCWRLEDEKKIHFRGIICDEKFLYVCQCRKHQIECWSKAYGQTISSWGLINSKRIDEKGYLWYPMCIYLDTKTSLYYVGDLYSVQIFAQDGFCIERLTFRSRGHLFRVRNLWTTTDQLFIYETTHRKRIQLWQRIKET